MLLDERDGGVEVAFANSVVSASLLQRRNVIRVSLDSALARKRVPTRAAAALARCATCRCRDEALTTQHNSVNS
jgi:hypothetical protein